MRIFILRRVKNYNWVNLFGIESPRLTSALSIAKYVKKDDLNYEIIDNWRRNIC